MSQATQHSLNTSGAVGADPHGAIRVFLLDDHEVVRRGVRGLLESDPGVRVVGEAATVEEALTLAPLCEPDVAVLDVRLPDGSGVTVCRQLRSLLPALRCLMMTSFADDEALIGAVMAGASGYVLKQIRGTDVLGAVRSVAAGGTALDSQTTAMVMEEIRRRATFLPELESLTQSEREVLEQIGEGLTNREIGERLGLSEKMVRNRVSTVLNKLGLQRRTQAAIFVTEVHLRAEGA